MVPAELSFCNWFLTEEYLEKGHSDPEGNTKRKILQVSYTQMGEKILWNLMTVRIDLRFDTWPSAHKDPNNNCHLELVCGTRIWWEYKFCCVRDMWVLKGRWTPRVWLNCASLLCVFVSGSRTVELQQQWISIDFQVSLGASSIKWMLTKLNECHRASLHRISFEFLLKKLSLGTEFLSYSGMGLTSL